MVEHRSSTMFHIYGKMNRVANLKAPFFYSAPMDCKLRSRMLGISDFYNITAGGLDGSPVAHLATRFAIKRCLSSNDIDIFVLNGFRLSVSVAVDGQNCGFSFQTVVADEGDWTVELNLSIHAGSFSRITATGALLIHQLLEACLIDGHLIGAQNVLGQIQWKTVSVVETKGNITSKDCLFILLQFRGGILEENQAFF